MIPTGPTSPPTGTSTRAPDYPRALKKQVTLRLDPDILDWFKRQGTGYQTRINAALRAFVEAHEKKG